MRYYLGIDGGGTKTKFVIGGADGNITGEYTGSPCHYMQCGFDGLERLIHEGVGLACSDAGIKPADIAFAFGSSDSKAYIDAICSDGTSFSNSGKRMTQSLA